MASGTAGKFDEKKEDSQAERRFLPGKTSWPELVGTDGEAAVVIIKRENPLVDAFVVADGSSLTMDYIFNRVRVIVDAAGIVDKVPTAG